MLREGRRLRVAIFSEETYSIRSDWSNKRIDSEKKSGGYTEVIQLISHMGSPVWESRTPDSTGGVSCEGRVYQLKPHAGFWEVHTS